MTDRTISRYRLVAELGRGGMGVACGTVAYMSPKQVRGKPLDARSDIFSVGATLCEMVTAGSADTRSRLNCESR